MYRKQNLDMTRYRGLSTDTKPDADFGSTFHEMDTGDIYRFDGSEWQKCGSLAGTDPSIYMSMWGARGNTKKAWALSALAGGHSDPGILKTVTGNLISVSDALAAKIKSLSVSLSPIQSGSGDPYPAGGGKNKFNKDAAGNKTNCFISSGGTEAYSTRYTASDFIPVTAESAMIVSGLTELSAAIRTAFYDSNKDFLSAVTQNQPTYTFTTPSGAAYLRLSVPQVNMATAQLEYGSTATAYAPYENICPITGRTEVTVTRTGKNILNLDNFENGLMSIYIGDSISAITPSARYIHSATYDASKGLYVTAQSLDASKIEWCVLCVYNNDVLANRYFLPITGASPATVSIASETYEKAIIQFRAVSGNIALSCIDSIKASFSIGSTATDYEPYDDQSATIQLGQTVYGGTVDVIAGKLTVNWAKIVLNGTQQISRENWKPQAKSVGWIYPYDLTRNIVGTGAVLQNIKCDTLPSMPFNSLQSINGPGIALASNQTYGISVMYPNTTLTTASAINAFLAEHPIDVVYELAEPFDIDLTPASLSTLSGDNTVWSDGDDISMTYKAAAA